MTASPHNGHPNSFAALMEILDPQRFLRGMDIEPPLLEPVMVRRLKEDLRRLGQTFLPALARADCASQRSGFDGVILFGPQFFITEVSSIEHRLFLTASPHNGHPNSFAALMEILDPQRFLRGMRLRWTPFVRQPEPLLKV